MLNARVIGEYQMFHKLIYLWLAWSVLVGAASGKEGAQEPESPRNKAARTGEWIYRGLEINYALLNAADLATTIYGLRRGAREVNPVARVFVRNTPAAIAVKGGFTFGVLWALRKAKESNRTAAFATLGALNLIYGVIVRNNIGVAVKLD